MPSFSGARIVTGLGRGWIVPEMALDVSRESSTNQFDFFVASFVDAIWPDRSAANLGRSMASVHGFVLLSELAMTPAVFRRRLTRSSESESEE